MEAPNSSPSRVQAAVRATLILVSCVAFLSFAIACWQGRISLRPLLVTPELDWLAGLLFEDVTGDKLARNHYVYLSGFVLFAFDLTVLLPGALQRALPEGGRAHKAYLVLATLLLCLACLAMLLYVRPVYGGINRWLVGLFHDGSQARSMLTGALEAYAHLPFVSIALAVLGWLVPACALSLRDTRPNDVSHKAAVAVARLSLAVAAGILVTALAAAALTLLDPLAHEAVRAVRGYCLAFASSGYNCLSTIVLAPVVEETMFRGLMQHHLRRCLPFWAALLITSVAFGVWHWNLGQFAYTFLFALLVGCIYEATGCIAYTICAHVTMNLSAVLAYSINSSCYFGQLTVMPGLREAIMGLPLPAASLAFLGLATLLGLIVYVFFRLRPNASLKDTAE